MALALAALTDDKGPEFLGLHVVPVSLLVVGLPALIASLHAMTALWARANMNAKVLLGLIGGPRIASQPSAPVYHALVWSLWTLELILIAYVTLLFANAV